MSYSRETITIEADLSSPIGQQYINHFNRIWNDFSEKPSKEVVNNLVNSFDTSFFKSPTFRQKFKDFQWTD